MLRRGVTMSSRSCCRFPLFWMFFFNIRCLARHPALPRELHRALSALTRTTGAPLIKHSHLHIHTLPRRLAQNGMPASQPSHGSHSILDRQSRACSWSMLHERLGGYTCTDAPPRSPSITRLWCRLCRHRLLRPRPLVSPLSLPHAAPAKGHCQR